CYAFLVRVARHKQLSPCIHASMSMLPVTSDSAYARKNALCQSPDKGRWMRGTTFIYHSWKPKTFRPPIR
ncbi:MAG: hypothetical protein K2N39_06175, partial [Lachnospiraceae bacterium]|nr:hypothetical protein [Lachnospiraceae bacterium]